MNLAKARRVERATRKRFWRDIALTLLTGAVACAGLVAVLAVLFSNSPGNQFVRKYHQLKVGMANEDVNRFFGKSPEYSCTFKSYRICYYLAPSPFGGTRNPDLSHLPDGAVASASELPYIYAAVQVAFDADGKLAAFTRNGETHVIVTTGGEVPGSSLEQLDEAFFQ